MDIRVDGIAKTFGVSPALHGVDLTIRSGELIGLLGPSGSGKTTLLRIIAGLEQPSAGRLLFGEEDASRRSVQERRVGFVFQHYALFRHMSVADNVAYGLRVRPRRERPAAAEIDRRVRELLELVQLGDFGRRYPAQLSGGQRQRVALARALAVEPKVLLLDEPFGALDAKVRKDLRRWLREIHDRTGHTTVFVTHDQDEALELSDRIAVLAKGRIEQLGEPDEIYERPATPFVFGFIGESSRLDVAIVGGQVMLDGIPLGLETGSLPDGPAALFVRPQDLALVDPGSGAIDGLLTAQRRAGPTRRAEVMVGSGRRVLDVECPASRPVQIGRIVGLRVGQATLFGSAGAVHHLRGAQPEVILMRPGARA